MQVLLPGRTGRRLTALLAVLLAWGVACRPAPQPPPPHELRVGLHSLPLTLDPHRRNEAVTFGVLSNIYEALTSFDPHLDVQPGLAESWENPDNLTWRFHLRPGVRFHDGRPFTSADVVAALDRARTLPGGDMSSYLVEVTGVRAVDELTVEVSTARPYAILLNKLAFVLITPRGTSDTIERPIGTGPYRFRDETTDARLRLQANDAYWGPEPSIRDVTIVGVADPHERVRQLESGQLDAIEDVPFDAVDSLRQETCCEVVAREGLIVEYLLPRLDRPPFDDRRVRRALDLALDRPGLVTEMTHGQGRSASQMVGLDVFGFDAAIRPHRRDVAAARQLLAEAGHPEGIDVPIQFRESRNADVLELQLADAGIRLQKQQLPWDELYSRLKKGDFTLYYGGWLAPSADASDFFDSVAHSVDTERGYGQNNFNRYSNRELDALIERTGTALSMKDRRRLLQRAMGMVMDDLAIIPLYVPHRVYAHRHEVEWEPRLDGFFRASEVRFRRAGIAKRLPAEGHPTPPASPAPVEKSS